MKHVTGCLIAIAVSILNGCASKGPTAPADAATAATVPADFRIPAGYRQTRINGEERFCRKSIVTGTRVSNGEVCLSAAQIQAEVAASQSYIQGVQRAGAQKASCAPGVSTC